ncbi:MULTISPECIES: hypothetical protein [Rhizobium]|uniref:Uncharacterized protein n=1 Tax=Rhizobium miluonense TaxID=411945 RepID=A0A1C3WQT1_9HYPH|nr:hypothetical protein [Rhizobium miluonense]SCB42423.1 hypothetical protein GA0061102_103719 [Rhizobium miluonense]
MNAKTVLAAAVLQENAMATSTRRYAVRREMDSSWTVYDVFTGVSAKPSTWELENLPEKEARVFCAILNEKDAARRIVRDRK